MPIATTLIVILVLFSAALIGVLVARPGITATRGGKILAFLVLFFLPILCGAMGVSSEMERSKTTAFCLSCHTMEAYGKSLYIDDPGHIPCGPFSESSRAGGPSLLHLSRRLRDVRHTKSEAAWPAARLRLLFRHSTSAREHQAVRALSTIGSVCTAT